MLKQQLQALLLAVPDLVGVSIVGQDGIPLETQMRGDFDSNALAAEFADFVKGMQARLVDVKMGVLSSMTVETRDHRIVIEPVAADYFMLGLVRPGGIIGRARFQLRKCGMDVAPQLV